MDRVVPMKPQLALHLFKELEKKTPQCFGIDYLIFEKDDGWYGYIDFTGAGPTGQGGDRGMSRKMREIPSLREFSASLHQHAHMYRVPQGRMIFEIRVTGAPVFKDLNGLLNRSAGDCAARGAYIHVHDFIPAARNLPFASRYEIASKVVSQLQHGRVFLAPIIGIGTPTTMKLHFDDIVSRGGEGVIGKNPEAPYQEGKRNCNLLKIKEEVTLELKVIGVEAGRTGTKYARTLGKIVCVDSKGIEHPLSGMSDEERDLWWENPLLIIGQVIQAKAMKVLSNGSLREGRYECIRHDKSEID